MPEHPPLAQPGGELAGGVAGASESRGRRGLRLSVRSGLVALVAVAVVIAVLAGGDDARPQRSDGRFDRLGRVVPAPAAPGEDAEERWSAELDGGVVVDAVGAGELVVVALLDPPTATVTVRALDRGDGEQRWAASLPIRFANDAGLLHDGETVYATATDAFEGTSLVVALGAGDGAKRWTSTLDGRVTALSVRSSDFPGTGLEALSEGPESLELRRLDPDTGATTWRVRGQSIVASAEARGDSGHTGDELVFAVRDEVVEARSTVDGSLTWSTPVAGATSLASVDGVVVVLAADGLVGLGSFTGGRQWERSIEAGELVGLGGLAAVSTGDELTAFDSGGQVVWSALGIGRPEAVARVGDRSLFAVVDPGTVRVVDAADGREQGRVDVGSESVRVEVVEGGFVVVGPGSATLIDGVGARVRPLPVRLPLVALVDGALLESDARSSILRLVA